MALPCIMPVTVFHAKSTGQHNFVRRRKSTSKVSVTSSYHYAIACDGTIYEALDIRDKSVHIASGNKGVIGIVMLADLSVHGEAYKVEYASKSLFGKIKGIINWLPDLIDTTTDEPPEKQIKALLALVKVLRSFFPITMLGGHREYQKLSTGDGRACPGAYGMILIDMLRREYKLGEPKK